MGHGVVRVEVIGHKGRAILGRHARLAAIGPDGVHPLAHEVQRVGHIGGGQRVHLGVAGPAHALVPLGAVRGNGQVIAGGGIDDVGKQPVGQRVGGFIGRRGVQRRQHLHAHVLHGQGLFQPGDLDVAIAVEGQARAEGLLPRLHRVKIRGQRTSEVFHHQHAVDALLDILRKLGVQYLRVADGEGLPLLRVLGGDGEVRHAHQVLAHVVEVRAGLGLAQVFSSVQLADDVHRRVIPGDQLRFGELPAGFNDGGVHREAEDGIVVLIHRAVALALKQGSQLYRAKVGTLPAFIGDYGIGSAVGVVDHQLRHQRGLVAVVVVVGGLKGGHARPPALAQHSLHGIFALGEKIGDVVHVIGQYGVVLGRAGVEPLVRSNLFPVDIQIVDTLGGDVEQGPVDVLPGLKGLAQIRRAALGGICIGQEAFFAASHSKAFALVHFRHYRHQVVHVKQRAPGKLAAVFDFVIGECGAVAGIHHEAHAVQMGIAVAHLGHGDGRGVHHHAVHGKGQGGIGAEDVHMVRLILASLGEYGVQFLIRLRGGEGRAAVVIRVVADAIDVDLRAAVRGQAGKIHLHAHVVLPRQPLRVEGRVFQAEVVRAEDEGIGVAFLERHVGIDVKDGLARGIQRQGRRADPLSAVPGIEAVAHQRGGKARRIRFHRRAVLIDDGHLPQIGGGGLEGRALIEDAHGFGALHPAGIPDRVFIFIPYGDLIGRLRRARICALHPPGEGRLCRVDAEGVHPALGFEIHHGKTGFSFGQRGQHAQQSAQQQCDDTFHFHAVHLVEISQERHSRRPSQAAIRPAIRAP